MGIGTAKVQLSLAGSVSDYTSSVQDKIKSEIASSAGCTASQITLAVAAGSVVITATMPSSSASKLVANVKSGQLKTLGGQTVTGATLKDPKTSAPTTFGGPFKCYTWVTGPLKIDGILKHHTITNLQQFLNKNLELSSLKNKYLYNLKVLATDGMFGKKTKTELQRFLNTQTISGVKKLKLDGDFGPLSNAALQAFLKVDPKNVTPTTKRFNYIVDKVVGIWNKLTLRNMSCTMLRCCLDVMPCCHAVTPKPASTIQPQSALPNLR